MTTTLDSRVEQSLLRLSQRLDALEKTQEATRKPPEAAFLDPSGPGAHKDTPLQPAPQPKKRRPCRD